MRRGRPGRAGQGIGGAPHNALITGLPHGRALLPTYRDERPAPGLATARGWEHLVEGLDEDSDLHGLKIEQAR